MYKVGDRVKLNMDSLCHDAKSIVRNFTNEGQDYRRVFEIVNTREDIAGSQVTVMLGIDRGNCACQQSGEIGWWVQLHSVMEASCIYIGGE